MGLVAKLGTTAGGIDKRVAAAGATPEGVRDPFSVRRGAPGAVPPGAVREARLERDGEGRVVRVVHLGRERNPLGDLLGVFDKEEGEPRDEWAGIEDRDGDEGRPEVLRLLEKEAGVRTERVVRHQSTREAEWLGRLVGKYGADVEAMAMDMKMNPMQQTAADVRKRLKKAGFLTE